MDRRNSKSLGVVPVGELLIDLISRDFANTFEEVENFERLSGGSPTNLVMDMAKYR